jgi:hypothetical protein
MKRRFLNLLALVVIAGGASVLAFPQPADAAAAVCCTGGGITCCGKSGCSASENGCSYW